MRLGFCSPKNLARAFIDFILDLFYRKRNSTLSNILKGMFSINSVKHARIEGVYKIYNLKDPTTLLISFAKLFKSSE